MLIPKTRIKMIIMMTIMIKTVTINSNQVYLRNLTDTRLIIYTVTRLFSITRAINSQ